MLHVPLQASSMKSVVFCETITLCKLGVRKRICTCSLLVQVQSLLAKSAENMLLAINIHK